MDTDDPQTKQNRFDTTDHVEIFRRCADQETMSSSSKIFFRVKTRVPRGRFDRTGSARHCFGPTIAGTGTHVLGNIIQQVALNGQITLIRYDVAAFHDLVGIG